MIDKLQSVSTENRPQTDPRVVHISSDAASDTLEAISSETAREIMATLHENPQPPSRIAKRVDTSLANVNYHLDSLAEAGLVTDVDTRYSEKGKEMKVYAPTDDPLVFAGSEKRTSRVRSLLGQVGTALVFLVAASALVQWFVSDWLGTRQPTAPLRKATSAGTIEGATGAPIPPGVLFFTGGTFVLTVTVAVWYLWRRTP